MKQILLPCFLFVCLIAQAQNMGAIRDGFNVDHFPLVSFTYHDYTPQRLDKSDFQYLKEGGENRDFELVALSEDHSQEPQSILFLWEDMAHNGRGQFEFTKKVLSDFFNEVDISSDDRIAISVFNRRKNALSALNDLTNGFTNNKERINQAIESYHHSTEYYPEFPNRSDMYSAIREGIDLLVPLDGVKSIVVFTSGYSMKNSGSDSESQVLLQAQRKHIPVYIVQYYYKSGVAPESEGFAKGTNGIFKSYKEALSAKNDLVNIYPKIRERYYGHSYKISFISRAKRGEEARAISLKVRGVEIQEQFLPPSFSIKTWIKENVWLSLGIAFAFIGLIILIFWINHKNNIDRNRRVLENEAKLHNEISASNQAVANLKRQQELKEQQRQAEIEKEENERLIRLMHTKNMFPRLQCQIGDSKIIHNIDKPRTTIGREEDNDLMLPNDKVSRHHAEIIFTGSGFEIIDNESTNRVIVNGRFFKQTVLNNGDIIGLGEVIIIFHI